MTKPRTKICLSVVDQKKKKKECGTDINLAIVHTPHHTRLNLDLKLHVLLLLSSFLVYKVPIKTGESKSMAFSTSHKHSDGPDECPSDNLIMNPSKD